MKSLSELSKEFQEERFTLYKTMDELISEEQLNHSVYRWLMDGFACDDRLAQVIAAIVATAINQRRVTFKLCREMLELILKTEPHLKKYKLRKNAGLKSNFYSTVLRMMRGQRFLFRFHDNIKNAYGAKTIIVEIIEPEIVELITALSRYQDPFGLGSCQLDEISDFYTDSASRREGLLAQRTKFDELNEEDR